MKNKHNPDDTREIIEKHVFSKIEWQENLTILDLSNRGISDFDENINLPENLAVLNLANNQLQGVPITVLKLNKLKTLDLSYNEIELFNETPNAYHTLESLNLKNNKLVMPPSWVWVENAKKIVQLNLSYNHKICQSLVKDYFEELLQYTTQVRKIDLQGCCLGKHMKLMSTFKHARVVNLGNDSYNYLCVNHIEYVPSIGLEDCREVEILNLSNTHIYNIEHNIDIYQCLKELNLSNNNINSLPNEFCNLLNMEICVLSYNKILYLPEDMHKLVKLTKLYLNNNELCMLPDTLCKMDSLKTLDLYMNHLYEGVDDIKNLEEYDFAQNYNNEPDSEIYLKKKAWLRQNHRDRLDGRAPEVVQEGSECSEHSNNIDYYSEDDALEVSQTSPISRSSTPEDWDSDDFWVPSHGDYSRQWTSKYYQGSSSSSPMAMQWLDYVKRKMEEGNFCPMDMHLSISITEKVKYEKMHNPKPQYESDGQFDDYSDDDS
ncbi:unnamed protein product [Arctia plantaginis]|uniref:Leucine-rich repeat protein n=1 Tax=Arctia plantaginis TaxID=874455 RepID=A0A8S1B4Q2_ARCPL|nr:unnamed protein product [Arctia plantaginis]